MNPKEFDWSESQQVTVINPTAEEFVWQVHGKEYRLPAGLSASMPGYLAWVYVYGQATKLAQAENKWTEWNDLPIRKEYYAKFVAGIQPVIQQIEVQKSLVETLDGDELDDVDDEDRDDATLPPGGSNYTPKKAGKNVSVAPTA